MEPNRIDVTGLVERIGGRYPKFRPTRSEINAFIHTNFEQLLHAVEIGKLIFDGWEWLFKKGREREKLCRYVHPSLGGVCNASVHFFYEQYVGLVAMCEIGHRQIVAPINVNRGVV